MPKAHISSTLVNGNIVPISLPPAQTYLPYHLITVKNNGIGFRKENAERIFNVFTLLHSNTEHRGSGIGLSIVQRIVGNHKGFIWAESEPEKGAIFSILLPTN